MTHDLIKNVLEAVEAKVEKIVVNDLRENTFFALIHLRLGEEEITVDSRPLRRHRPGAAGRRPDLRRRRRGPARQERRDRARRKETDDQEKLKEWLENLKPEDFGKAQDVAAAS